MSKQIKVASDLAYVVSAPTSFLFQIAVVRSEHQHVINETVTVEPVGELEVCQTGLLGNTIHRLSVDAGPVTVRYRADVTLAPRRSDVDTLSEVAHADLPADVLPFLNPSRYCESDKLLKFAHDAFGSIVPGYARVAAIVDWVNRRLDYLPGTTGSSTTACDVLLGRAGVCRDYAHVTIALLRALGIPARYVAGYAHDLDPPDFHGFCEAWLGDDWYLFDATYLAPVSGFVRIGAGRDAADVSFATCFGTVTTLAPVVSAILASGGHDDGGKAVSSA